MAGVSVHSKVIERQANAGLKLFKLNDVADLETDLPAAERFKAETDARIAALEAEVAELSGKEHKKERIAKSKQVSELKTCLQYIDACKVSKGLQPRNGYFLASGGKVPPAPDRQPEEAQEKRPRTEDKEESAGLSPAEAMELEKLKKDIVERKADLKAQGLGCALQSKDPQVLEWVTRLQVLKDKQEPGSTQKDAGRKKESKKTGPLNEEEQMELEQVRADITAYRYRLRIDCGFSAKDIRLDKEMQRLESRLEELERREE